MQLQGDVPPEEVQSEVQGKVDGDARTPEIDPRSAPVSSNGGHHQPICSKQFFAGISVALLMCMLALVSINAWHPISSISFSSLMRAAPSPFPPTPPRPPPRLLTPELIVRPHPKMHGAFCVRHWGMQCSRCVGLINNMPRSLATLDGHPRPHLLYLHVEKTGGSAIECATEGQDLVNNGFFTNLGHTTLNVVQGCKNQCKHGNVSAKTVISIREPYQWWRSLYTYGYVCKAAAVCTKQTFAAFMRTMERQHHAQSDNIKRECGVPCLADYYLHTETLEDDFLSLQRNLSMTPIVGLPITNPTSTHVSIPRTIFTREVVNIIHQLDARMFTEFRYRKRTDIPFELPSTDHHGRLL